ncbi:hypothetical protein G5714_009291 [Onychostoma macrolepis]|uniref:Uncharacterized protein n=1 Tax=Onychostoma macrolepis TaxID=369639 RepID=A0A7J6CRT4_9TELE|nr:hypothetical protein G5714_009291 [Onychostoma macrolepis]
MSHPHIIKDTEDCHRHLTLACGDLENYQAGEPEDTPERTATPADSVQEALDEMEERPNKMRERIKETLYSLKRELDELEGGCELMQPHPSPHDYVQRKQYKQVAGTLVMQDLEYPDDRFQRRRRTQIKKGIEKGRNSKILVCSCEKHLIPLKKMKSIRK